MTRLVIIDGNPRAGGMTGALADACAEGALSAGHEVELFRLSDMAFDPVLRSAFSEIVPLEPDLEALHAAVLAADHLVVVHPLWFGDMPAMLKGLIDRLFQGEGVESMRAGKLAKPLRGKSARIVITMSMPGFVYRWIYGAPVVKIWRNHIIGFLGARPVRAWCLGMIDTASADKRAGWLQRLHAHGRRPG